MPRPSKRQISQRILRETREKNNSDSGLKIKGKPCPRPMASGTDSEWVDSGSDGGHEDTESESDGAEYDKDDDIWHPLQVFISRLQHEEAEPAPKKNWEGSGNSERSIQRRRKQAREKQARGMEWRRTNPAITSFFSTLPACEEKHDTGDGSDGDLTACSANGSCSDSDDEREVCTSNDSDDEAAGNATVMITAAATTTTNTTATAVTTTTTTTASFTSTTTVDADCCRLEALYKLISRLDDYVHATTTRLSRGKAFKGDFSTSQRGSIVRLYLARLAEFPNGGRIDASLHVARNTVMNTRRGYLMTSGNKTV